jgi:hypothetical protein
LNGTAAFFYLIINGTWAFIAYLLHQNGLSTKIVVVVTATGVVMGNLAAYVGMRAARRMLNDSRRNRSTTIGRYNNPNNNP